MFRMRGATARIGDPTLDECVIDFLQALADEWIENKAKDPDDDTPADAIAALHERIGHLMREL
ncbi:MAG TPA: hypothetical protein VFI59_02205 [Actinomycetota bacterium]|nr:hypothetical protein [Actinomycetota bacterium]